VVAPEGERVMASPTKNADLYYALGGGGAGNFGVLLAMTMKLHKDGPVPGARLTFTHTYNGFFMQGVRAWIEHTQVLGTIPGFHSDVRMVKGIFSLAMATLPDVSASQVAGALAPFHGSLY
jgi:FAD/FMN-containing dehydrogenase